MSIERYRIMFDFLRKEFLWRALDAGYLDKLDNKISYQLKTAQDLSIYEILRDKENLDIAEIGGGNSRILRRLAQKNRCVNIEKFEGLNAGPGREIVIEGVRNLHAYIGDFDECVPEEGFDVAFSVSVVEHIEDDGLEDFYSDVLRILKPGGLFLHAIDMYVQNEPMEYAAKRLSSYRRMLDDDRVKPLGEVREVIARFDCSMVSNPDNIMHGWNLYAPHLSELRQLSQNVSLIIGGVKD